MYVALVSMSHVGHIHSDFARFALVSVVQGLLHSVFVTGSCPVAVGFLYLDILYHDIPLVRTLLTKRE